MNNDKSKSDLSSMDESTMRDYIHDLMLERKQLLLRIQILEDRNKALEKTCVSLYDQIERPGPSVEPPRPRDTKYWGD